MRLGKPPSTRLVDPARADALWYWMTERHKIYTKRSRGVPREQWTSDPILMEYRFCNVFRELDRVTIWVRKSWRDKYSRHPNLWFAMCVARQINWPDTLAEAGFPDGPMKREAAIENMRVLLSATKKADAQGRE